MSFWTEVLCDVRDENLEGRCASDLNNNPSARSNVSTRAASLAIEEAFARGWYRRGDGRWVCPRCQGQ